MSLAIAFGAFVKGVAGAGLPILAVPLLSAIVGVEHAISVMIIPSFVSNVVVVFMLRKEMRANWELLSCIGFGLVGTTLGAWLLAIANREVMFLVLAAWVGFYLLLRQVKPDFQIPDERTGVVAPPVGFVTGIFQSATGLSFPVFGPYWQARNLSRDRFAFNASALLMSFSFIQGISFLKLGMLTPERMTQGAAALIPLFIALVVGLRVGPKLDYRRFNMIITGLLIATALVLVYRGVTGIPWDQWLS